MNILFTNKNGGSIPTKDIIKIFEEVDNLKTLKQSIEKAEERIYVTWASVETKDEAGELIPINDIIKEQDILLERNGPITDEHTNRFVGTTLAYKILEHPKSKTLGVVHLNKIFAHNEIDEQVWGEITRNERKGSSVGGYNTFEHKGTDPDTGEKVNVLEGFRQLETASVFNPCNPLALNESFSLIAKSAKSNKRCKGCPKEPKKETNLNKKEDIQSIDNNKSTKILKKEGDTMKREELLKLQETAKALVTKVDKLLKQEEEKPEDEEKQDEEEEPGKDEEKKKKKKKKQDEEEKPEDEVEKQDEEEDEEEVTKEDAKGDVEGESDAPSPEAPTPESSNDKDVMKKDLKQVKKNMEEMKKTMNEKLSTPRPDAHLVKKHKDYASKPLDIALGKKKFSYGEVHKMNKDHLEGN